MRRRPGLPPQHLAFSSQHRLSTRLGIYRGEAVRHMMNCSKESDYQRLVEELESTLHRRGYPRGCFDHLRIRYDRSERLRRLEKLHARTRQPTKPQCGNIVVFKTPHTPLTRKLGIQSEFSKLKRDLQRTLGDQVLDGVKVVVANPIDSCVFRDTYGMNFPVDTFPSS